jgi:peptidoglycan/LPS O-acetylase OafA/YrhL
MAQGGPAPLRIAADQTVVLVGDDDDGEWEAEHPSVLPLSDAGFLASLCTAPNWFKTPLTLGPLPLLGRISYSFFLIHQPTSWYAMEFFRKKLGYSGAPLVLLGYTAGLLITILCSSVFYSIFEKPFLSSTKKTVHPLPVPSRQPQSVA